MGPASKDCRDHLVIVRLLSVALPFRLGRPVSLQDGMPVTKFAQELVKNGGPNPQLGPDLSKISSVDNSALMSLVKEAGASYPCNVWEMAAVEAKDSTTDHQNLFDVASALLYVSDNSENDPPEGVVADLVELKLLDPKNAPTVLTVLKELDARRTEGKAASAYKTIGPALLWDIEGTVDLRCRFHASSRDFRNFKKPQAIADVRPVVIATMFLKDREQTRAVPFQMDEHDLSTLRRFVDNMANELTLATELIPKKKTEVNRG